MPEMVFGIVAGSIAAVVALLRRVGEGIRYARIRHQSIRELSRLRDKDLRDMGISRHQIEASVDRMMQQARDKH